MKLSYSYFPTIPIIVELNNSKYLLLFQATLDPK